MHKILHLPFKIFFIINWLFSCLFSPINLEILSPVVCITVPPSPQNVDATNSYRLLASVAEPELTFKFFLVSESEPESK